MFLVVFEFVSNWWLGHAVPYINAANPAMNYPFPASIHFTTCCTPVCIPSTPTHLHCCLLAMCPLASTLGCGFRVCEQLVAGPCILNAAAEGGAGSIRFGGAR